MDRSEFEDRTNDWLPSCVRCRRIRRLAMEYVVLLAAFATVIGTGVWLVIVS